MFDILRPCFFRPERTWGKFPIYPGNAGHKGHITAQQGWLHMNAYSVLLSPRLKVGSEMEENAKDRGKLEGTGIRKFFGKEIVPEF